MSRSPLPKNLKNLPLVIDPKKSRLRIHKQTLALLDNPQYIQLLVNPEKKIILLCPVSSYQAACERIKWEQLSESKCCEIYSTSFIEKLMLLSDDWNENMSYKLNGTLLPKQKVIMYHMQDAVVGRDMYGEYRHARLHRHERHARFKRAMLVLGHATLWKHYDRRT